MSSNKFNNNIHKFLTFIVQTYPLQPNNDDIENYRQFITTLYDILPQDTYSLEMKQYIEKNQLTDDIMKERILLCKWLINVENLNDTDIQIRLSSFDMKITDLDPKIWGRYGWDSIYFIVINYSVKPDEDTKKKYKKVLENLGYVLPCNICKNNYVQELKQFPLNDRTMSSKYTLVSWYGDIRNSINSKLLLNRQSKSKTIVPELIGLKVYRPPSNQVDGGSIRETIKYLSQNKETKNTNISYISNKTSQTIEQSTIKTPSIVQYTSATPQHQVTYYPQTKPYVRSGCNCGKR